MIEGNFLNLNAEGTSLLVPASASGHSINVVRSPNTHIGGSSAAARNVIVNSASPATNVNITASSNCVVTGNHVGTDTTGTTAVGSAFSGVSISTAPGPNGQARDNRIGGTVANERNVISGGNQTGIILGGNVNTVQGNYIGTDASGTNDLGNSVDGVLVGGSNHVIGTPAGTTLGGACTGGCNLISGNDRDGVRITGFFTAGNRLDYNYVGLNVAGTAALRNSGDAISLRNGASNNFIGRLLGNTQVAVENAPEAIRCIRNAGTGDYVEFDDKIGLNLTFTWTSCRTGLTITGTGEVRPNDSESGGITLSADGLEVTTDSSGTGYALIIPPADSFVPPIVIYDSNIFNSTCVCPTDNIQTTIGTLNSGHPNDQEPPLGNIFSHLSIGSSANGIFDLSNPATDGNIRHQTGNSNTYSNVFIITQRVRSVTPIVIHTGTDNVITGLNVRNVISVPPSPPVFQLIDLNGDEILNPNDELDADGGANRTQDYPAVRLLTEPGGNVRVTGVLNSTPGTRFRIRLETHRTQLRTINGIPFNEDFFNDTGISFEVITDANGVAQIEKVYSGAEAAMFRSADNLFAMATVVRQQQPLILGDTSEFSPSFDVPGVTVSGRVTTPSGLGLRNATVAITDNSSGVRRTAVTSSFGFYSFDDVSVYRAYTIGVSSKRYRFAPRILRVDDSLTDVNFTGLE